MILIKLILILFQWKLPLLEKTISIKRDEEIGVLMNQIQNYKPLVEILLGIRSLMSMEVCFYERMVLYAADINQYINKVLQSVKSFVNRSIFDLVFDLNISFRERDLQIQLLEIERKNKIILTKS